MINFYYSDEYFNHDTGSHPESIERIKVVKELLFKEYASHNFIEPSLATKELISNVHDINYIDNIFTFLNVDLKNNEFLNLINLNAPKTIYAPTETTPFLVCIVKKFIKNKVVVVLENNEIARKVFQDCQSFLGKKSTIIFIPEIET